MPDVAAQIREQLAAKRHNAQKRGIDADEERDPRLAKLAADAEDLAGALLAVLDEHQPMELLYGDDETDHICGACRYFTSEWPCPTVAAVAEKLGIEAT